MIKVPISRDQRCSPPGSVRRCPARQLPDSAGPGEDGDIGWKDGEVIRPDESVERLAQLRPSFAAFGKAGFETTVKNRYPEVDRLDYVHHAGNSSGIADGAAAMLIGSAAAGDKLGLKPRARILAMSQVGIDTCIMLTEPDETAKRCLSPRGINLPAE